MFVMKAIAMPIDQYKMSIEAKPLHVLYSKYNPEDNVGTVNIVRPLGAVRRKRERMAAALKSQLPRLISHETSAGPPPVELGSIHVPDLCSSDVKMAKAGGSFRSKSQASADSYGAVCTQGKDGQLPSLIRSKTQTFENRYKIAAARSPEPKPSKPFSKKVVHLPLFRIDVKTYHGDADISKTVESTRESLRQILEMQKDKLRPATVLSANITNCDFIPRLTPRSEEALKSKCFSTPSSANLFGAFRGQKKENVDALVRHSNKKYNVVPFSGLQTHDETSETTSDSGHGHDGEENSDGTITNKTMETQYISEEEEVDDMLSLALRPDTALTLGSTMNQLDRVLQSPTSDELRAIQDALRNSESRQQPAWPSYEDVQKMQARNNSSLSRYVSKTPFSRPQTVFSLSKESLSEHSHHLHSKPVLRYTSKTDAKKLVPIVIPSHACTECPMCNIYQGDSESTSCPPNSPTPGTQDFEDFDLNYNNNDGLYSNRKGIVVKNNRKQNSVRQEVLHMPNVTVKSGAESIYNDKARISYMNVKA